MLISVRLSLEADGHDRRDGPEDQELRTGQLLARRHQAGLYTVIISKPGYVRQVRSGVVVSAGKLADLDVSLSGEVTEMEEFVVQDALKLKAGTEASLLQLRFKSPSLMDSISSDLMSRAGASDAASALRLVAGATVQDGKSAVIRGLPDRYVSSQMNGVRLPTADEDKRAVELDQFPSAVIESIQVSKTFTPDQQGDASGGAVNVRLKGVPGRTLLHEVQDRAHRQQLAGDRSQPLPQLRGRRARLLRQGRRRTARSRPTSSGTTGTARSACSARRRPSTTSGPGPRADASPFDRGGRDRRLRDGLLRPRQLLSTKAASTTRSGSSRRARR